MAQRVVRSLESLPAATVGCVRRRRRRADCFDCAMAAVMEEHRDEKRETEARLAVRGAEKIAKEFSELVQCACVKCHKEPCEYHR